MMSSLIYSGGLKISVKKQVLVSFLFDRLHGSSTLRQTDVMVYMSVGEKHGCVELNGVSPLVGLGTGAFTMGQEALKAASKTVDLLHRVQSLMHNNVLSPRSIEVVLTRIGFPIFFIHLFINVIYECSSSKYSHIVFQF